MLEGLGVIRGLHRVEVNPKRRAGVLKRGQPLPHIEGVHA
jgi:hypothetical protein